MLRPILFILLLLAAGALALRAQDYPATPIDGPVVKADSLRQKPGFSPLMGYSIYARIRMQGVLAPIGFESREERAARINAATSASVLRSVSMNLDLYRPPHYSREEILALKILRLFLSNPFGFPEGTVPMMSTSNPFVYAKTPGWAPYENPYSPDKIPQTVRTEYDFATGTYKLIPRPWSEVQMDLSRSTSAPFNNAPLPRFYTNATERRIMQ
jgi:hypothetical protein